MQENSWNFPLKVESLGFKAEKIASGEAIFPSFVHSFTRSLLTLRFVDQDGADEVGELADTLFAEQGIGFAVELRGVAGDHLRVAGVVRVLGYECGFAASRYPSLVLRLFGGRAGIALEVALLLFIDFLRTATEDATVRVTPMLLTHDQRLSFVQFAGDTFDSGGCFKLCHVARAMAQNDSRPRRSYDLSPCSRSSVRTHFVSVRPEGRAPLSSMRGNNSYRI